MDRPIRLGILCGGGPAPGMNSVIAAATIAAVKAGWEVVGIEEGFSNLMAGNTSKVRPLDIEAVSRLHNQGGSALYTSRANPTKQDPDHENPHWRLDACLGSLRELKIDALLTIGGDDTAHSANQISRRSDGALRVVHVPKTIDNDLPLPGGAPTFGYETARHVGTLLVDNLMADAMTTRRWYIAVAMGRSAGHLALGIGKAAAATSTIIAEEFPGDGPIPLKSLVDLIVTSMIKRRAMGHPYGVFVLSEGIGLRLPEKELLSAMPNIERDEHGHIRLAELHLHRILASLVKLRFHARGEKETVVAKNIGYELRCAPPIPFDIEYTRNLGFGAVELLQEMCREEGKETGAMVTLQDGELRALAFGSFNDPHTGRPMVRTVNTESESYHVARECMLRLEARDFEDTELLSAMARENGRSPEEFKERYGYLVQPRAAGAGS